MDYASQFATDPAVAFLNAGTLTRTPLAVLRFMETRRLAEEANPTRSSFVSTGVLWQAQRAIASYVGADPSDLFLRANVTAALNDFLFALPLEGGGEILATGLEYGATANLARLRAQQAGMSFRQVPLRFGPQLNRRDLAQEVIHGLRSETRVLILSHVVSGTGLILPIEEIGREAQEKGIVVVVDGAHAPGSMPLIVPTLPVDFYGGNLHKWFLGPKGTAFGWVHPSWRGHLEWRFGGWASFGMPAHFRDFGGSEEAAARMIPGTVDAVPFAALGEVIRLRAEWGEMDISLHQRDLRDLAAAEAEELGWERVSPRDPSLLGPLVSFRPPALWLGQAPGILATRILREAQVQLSLPMVQGEMLVRLSPGVYTSEAEIREGVRRLRTFRP